MCDLSLSTLMRFCVGALTAVTLSCKLLKQLGPLVLLPAGVELALDDQVLAAEGSAVALPKAETDARAAT